MHAAPPVSFPVAPGRFGAALLAAGWLAGLGVTAAWVLLAPGFDWRQGLGLLAVAGCAAWGWQAWRHGPRGQLAWDGHRWWWAQAGCPPCAGQAMIALDLQNRLLLHWLPAHGTGCWLWAERAQGPVHWRALRRALHVRAAALAAAPARPPVAEP